jgi:hypothetical protein
MISSFDSEFVMSENEIWRRMLGKGWDESIGGWNG